jgi:hypothetical protein
MKLARTNKPMLMASKAAVTGGTVVTAALPFTTLVVDLAQSTHFWPTGVSTEH